MGLRFQLTLDCLAVISHAHHIDHHHIYNISLAQGIKHHNLAFVFIESDITTYRCVSVPTVTKEKETRQKTQISMSIRVRRGDTAHREEDDGEEKKKEKEKKGKKRKEAPEEQKEPPLLGWNVISFHTKRNKLAS